ncbi:MAG: hypothetical protein ACD_75C00732G0011 [uncultured bacterium]|nr:MAG: hypothetical protein ACD_75C00732G0011 [uncultured bacterium]
MNQKVQIFVLMFFLMMSFGVSQSNWVQAADKKPKEPLAVLDLEVKHGVEKSVAEALSVIVRDKLHSYGEYQVMSKGDIQAVASREQLMQAMGCDDGGGQCLVDFGRAIGTRFMVAGDISKIGSTYTISLRMLDTKGEGAGVTNRVSYDCKCDDDALINAVRDVAAKLVGKPTSAVAKKAEDDARKLAEEKKKKGEEAELHRVSEEKIKAAEIAKKIELEATLRLADEKKIFEAEQKKLAEEKQKADEAEKQRQVAIAEEQRKVELEKERLIAEIETLKKDKETATIEAEKKRIVAESKKPDPDFFANLSPKISKSFTDPTTGMEFVLVPGGCFQMGDTFGDGQSNEKPVHDVCVDGFYMGKYEVTQSQYRTISGNNPSKYNKGDNYPVEKVSWNDAQSFIHLLNDKDGGKYRLPTEAEWEYAARSGGKSEKYSGGNDIVAISWYRDKSSISTHPVGQKQANGFGLHDMSGNVCEWCGDWFDSGYYGSSPRKNPEGPSTGSFRVFRGGSYNDDPDRLRAALRNWISPDIANYYLGFRLVLPVQRP